MHRFLRLLPCAAALFSLLTPPAISAVETMGHPPGMLGVNLDEVTATQVPVLKLPGEYGAWVRGVGPGSPAEKAGLKTNDVILSYNGQRVESARALQRMVQETPAGRMVELRVSRDGQPLLLRPELGAGSLPAATAARAPRSLGVWIEAVAPAVGQYLGLSDGVGMIVREVQENSPAAEAGVQPKDILVRLNDLEITSGEQLADAIRNLKTYSGKISLIRGTETLELDIGF